MGSPTSTKRTKELCTVKEFKELNAIGVGEFLEAGGIARNVVDLLRQHNIDGDSLYGSKYNLLKQIGLEFNDFLKIFKLIDSLSKEPVTLDTKGGSRTGDSKSAESKDFQANVALVIWNNYDGKEGVELENLREDVRNIKQTLKRLHFDIVKWGKDVKLKNFLEKLEEFYDKCMRSTDIGTVFVFYYGHGGRYKDRDGMIFDCGTHVPLSIVERKLDTLKHLRNIPTAIFFNACREDLKKWDKIFEDEKAKYSVTGSKEHNGSHIDMTKVLVVYACLKKKKAIYSFKKGSDSEKKYMGRVTKRPELQFEAGSPFGIVVAQRLWDDGNPYALHMAIQAIIDDMKEIGQSVDVPNLKHLNDLLPPFVPVPKARRKEKIVEVNITLLSKMLWKNASKDFNTLQEGIRRGVTVSTHKQRHGKCTLTKKLEVIPIPYDPEDEKVISKTNLLRIRVHWLIVAYYKLQVEEDKERLIKAIERKMIKYVSGKNNVYKWELNTRPGSLIANILIVLKHGHHKMEDKKFFTELLTFEIDGRKLEPNVTTSRQEWQHWNVAMMLNARVSSRIELMALMDAANITVGGYRFQACTAVVAEWRPNKVDKPKINPDQKAVEDKRKRDEGDNLAVEDERRRDKVDKAELKKGPQKAEDERKNDEDKAAHKDDAELYRLQKSIFEAVREGSFEVVKVLIPKYRSRLNINQLVDDKRRSLLHLACEYRRVDIARYLLDSKAEIDARDKWDKTPLLVACGKGNLPLVSCLVEAKANINATDSNSDGPLHIATELEDLELVKYLVENAKSDIKAVNKYGQTSLHIACRIKNLKILQLLLNAEPSVASSADKFGRTPLMVACRAVHLPTVQYLVEAKADVQAINSDGDGLLHLAAESRDRSMTRYLVKTTQANINAANNIDQTPLSIACRNGDLLMMKLLIDSKANLETSKISLGQTPFLVEWSEGNPSGVKCMVDAKANVDLANADGDGLLHLAAKNGDFSMVKYLVEKAQPNINALNIQGDGPLHFAVQSQHRNVSEIVEYLVQAKADIKAVNKQGDGPLHFAVQSQHRNVSEIVEYLVQAKADIKAVNKQGDGPLHIAVQSQGFKKLWIVQYLVQAKADIKAVNNKGKEPLHMAVEGGKAQTIKYLVESAKADIKAVNAQGDEPLHIAVRNGNLEAIQYLVEKAKANVKSVNEQGNEPLHMAAEIGEVQTIKYLVESAKADMKAVNAQGKGPLHIAVRHGNLEAMKYLVEKAKANVESVNKLGNGPLHIAVRNRNLMAMQYLVEKAKANVKSVNKRGDGPLHIAVQSWSSNNSGIVQYLVEAKADIKAVNKRGNEPLHMAAGGGKVQTIRYLVEVAKADMKAVNAQGDGPLHIAARYGNLEAMEYLVEKAKANVKSVNKQGQSPLAIAQEKMSSSTTGQSPLGLARRRMRSISTTGSRWKDIVRYLEKASSALNAEGQTDEKDEEHHQEKIERLKNELAKKAKDQDKNLIKKLEQAVRKHSPHMSQLKHEDKEVQL